jgi:hypothetical protein
MKRDMDLVWTIFLKLEEDIGLDPATYNFDFENSKISVPEHSDEEVYGHQLMLVESPYVKSRRMFSGEITVKSLTWPRIVSLDSVDCRTSRSVPAPCPATILAR